MQRQNNINADKQASPYSIRFTIEERKLFDEMAKQMDMKRAEFLRLKLFSGTVLANVARRTSDKQQPNTNLTQIIKLFEQTHISHDLNQMTRSIHMGTFQLNPDIFMQIEAIYTSIMWIQRTLLKGLNKPTNKKQIAQILALFGRSNLSNNLNQIINAIELGAVDLPLEIVSKLKKSYATAISIRGTLIKHTGLKEG